MGPFLQYSNEKAPDPTELRVYRGADGKFTLYEDEGDTYDYEKGRYASYDLVWNDRTHSLIIGPRHGRFTGMIPTRRLNIAVMSERNATGLGAAPPSKSILYRGKPVTVSFAR